jgi:hypothetical protein
MRTVVLFDSVKVITSTFREAVVLVTLIGRIYDVCRSDDLKWHDTNTASLTTISSGTQVTLRALPQQLERLSWYY